MRKIFNKFVGACRRNLKDHGVRGLAKTAAESWRFILEEGQYLLFHRRESKNVYERDWDLLILLDCARVDMMNEVADEYDFIDDVGKHISPGTTSGEWMSRTFTPEYRQEMSETLHITANTSSEKNLDSDQFLHLEEIWKDGWDEELGTIPAREVTDRIIHFSREYDAERILVHYMQPHLPFVNSEINANIVTPSGVKGTGLTLGELYEEGYSRKELWDASVDNLRYVLDDVELLLSNVDAERVVISSDHGQAFGEQGVWSHPSRTYIDVLKTVPWSVTSASDKETYHPEYDAVSSSDPDISIDEKLAALGYK